VTLLLPSLLCLPLPWLLLLLLFVSCLSVVPLLFRYCASLVPSTW
jgi:hypothetical protein